MNSQKNLDIHFQVELGGEKILTVWVLSGWVVGLNLGCINKCVVLCCVL